MSMQRTIANTRHSTMPVNAAPRRSSRCCSRPEPKNKNGSKTLKTYRKWQTKKMKPQSPEEIARAAQEAALEQMRAMMGSIPGMPDMGDMQAQIMARCRPQCQIWWRYRRSRLRWERSAVWMPPPWPKPPDRTWRRQPQTMQAMQDGSLEKELREANAAALDWLGEDDSWEIKHAATCRLTPEQQRLMAFAAPLLIYNDEAVDAVGSEVLPENLPRAAAELVEHYGPRLDARNRPVAASRRTPCGCDAALDAHARRPTRSGQSRR